MGRKYIGDRIEVSPTNNPMIKPHAGKEGEIIENLPGGIAHRVRLDDGTEINLMRGRGFLNLTIVAECEEELKNEQ